jgi:hypothetical protein
MYTVFWAARFHSIGKDAGKNISYLHHIIVSDFYVLGTFLVPKFFLVRFAKRASFVKSVILKQV